MTSALVSLLVLVLIAYLVYYVVGIFLPGTPQKIVGIILGIIVLVKALQIFGIALP